MTDQELNDHLISLSDTASDAHEMLRGILDAIAVLGRSTVRAAADDLDALNEDSLDEWREQATEVTAESESLLREAASLLKQTAEDIEAAADKNAGRSAEEESLSTENGEASADDDTPDDDADDDTDGEDADDDTDDDTDGDTEASDEEKAKDDE